MPLLESSLYTEREGEDTRTSSRENTVGEMGGAIFSITHRTTHQELLDKWSIQPQSHTVFQRKLTNSLNYLNKKDEVYYK